MDRTILYRELVRLANPSVEQPPEPATEPPFTRKASEINESIKDLKSYLISIRASYLATSGPQKLTDKERDEIDYNVRRILQQELASIKQLEKYESQRSNAVPTGFMHSLTHPAAKGIAETRHIYNQGILIYLNDLLKQASEIHSGHQRVRVSRDAHKLDRGRRVVSGSKTAPKLDTIPAAMGSPSPTQAFAASFEQPESQQLPPAAPAPPADDLNISEQQRQVLMTESSALLTELNATLNQAHQAERSMQEISSIQSELASHLASQTEMIQGLVDDAFKTTDDVGAANTQLEQAKKRNRRASKMIIYGSVGIGSLLLVYDYIF